jgi:hypothetical protein
LQTPGQPETDDNLLAFARHHYFNHRSLPNAPTIETRLVGAKLVATITFAAGSVPQRNTLSWCFDRSPPYTLAAEYDRWDSAPLVAAGEYAFTAEIEVPATARTVDVVSTHTHEEDGIPFHFSSPYQRRSR